MERNNNKQNIINNNISNSEDPKTINNNEKFESKSRLRKKAINKILMKKAVIFVEEITNEKLDEIESLSHDKQYEIIKSNLLSNNEPNILKILSYIIKVYCVLPPENKIRRKMMIDGKIIDFIVDIFYNTNNKDIYSLCSSIISTCCTDYINFSITMINEDKIKKVYNDLQNKYFNNPYIIANCINIYKQGLFNLIDQNNSVDIIENTVSNYNISYNSKRLLCNLVNWILYNKELYFSIPQEGMQSFFKLVELLFQSVSVPTQYEMNFDLNYSVNNTHNVHFENLILYIFSLPLKEMEYDTLENYLLLLIYITKEEKYFFNLTQYYNKVCIFDVIKKICGFMYLNNNSTDEERANYPVIEPIFISYCLQILINLIKETINHEDMMSLFLKFFKDYRGYTRASDIVPTPIMEFLVKLSENMDKDKKMYDFILSTKNNIINDCIKFYVRNNNCYILVMQFLINIFDVINFNEIENVKFNDVIKCLVDGLQSQEREVNNKSVYCLGKMIEINNRKKYNIDLIFKLEENQTVEKLDTLILNKKNSISEDENAEELKKYIENKIKEEEK